MYILVMIKINKKQPVVQLKLLDDVVFSFQQEVNVDQKHNKILYTTVNT